MNNYLIPPNQTQFQSLIQQLQSENKALHLRNINLENRLAKNIHAEYAFKELINVDHPGVFTIDKSGRPKLLLSHSIARVVLVDPSPPYRFSSFYAIYLEAVDKPILLSSRDFDHDKRLIGAFFQSLGVQVHIVNTHQTTAMLLRLAIRRKTVQIPMDFYAGWNHTSDGTFQFLRFSNGKTHCQLTDCSLEDCATQALAPKGEPQAVAMIYAFRINRLFQLVEDFPTRFLVWLWFHAAILCSLLEQLHNPIPIFLAFFTTDHASLSFLARLFAWCDDAISLKMRPSDFSDALLSRCDQPLLIREDQLDSTKDNVRMLIEAMADRSVFWKSGSNSKSLPLRALPTILTSRISSLTCSPEIMVLDIPPKCINASHFSEREKVLQDLDNYLCVFTQYVAQHIPELENTLTLGRKDAISMVTDQLSGAHFDAFAIMLALSRFLDRFLAYCQPSKLDLPPEADRIQLLQSLLIEASQRADNCCDLTDTFVRVASHDIRHGVLTLRSIQSQEDLDLPDSLTVYADQHSLAFTNKAFVKLCWHPILESMWILLKLPRALDTSTSLRKLLIYCSSTGQNRITIVWQ